jgi:hypothetical protein
MSGFLALGEVWEQALRTLYEDGSYTNKQMAEKLGVSRAYIKKRITLLSAARKAINQPTPEHGATTHQDISRNFLDENRKALLAVREANPNLGRAELCKRLTSVYQWLLRHDRQWLEMNLPPRQNPQGPPGYVNWPRRDEELEIMVREEAKRMRQATGRPVQISVTGVAKRVGKLTVISKNADKLPLTVKALNEVAESQEAYAVRRVLWAADCYRVEGVSPNQWQLQIRAAVSNQMAKREIVKASIQAAVLELEPLRQNSAKVRNFNVIENGPVMSGLSESSPL